MAELLILIGLPGSGKSTLGQRWATLWGWDWVSTDAIRAELYGDERIQGEWLRILGVVEQRLQTIVTAQKPGAIYDATNAHRQSRQQLIQDARSWGYARVSALWLDVPFDICVRQNQRRDRTVPLEILERMNRQLQDAPPSPVEGLDSLIRYRPMGCMDNSDRDSSTLQ